MEWEDIEVNTQRAKVFGGWLVKTYEEVHHITDVQHHGTGWDWRVSMAFVPDVNHEWKVQKVESE